MSRESISTKKQKIVKEKLNQRKDEENGVSSVVVSF